MALHCTALQCSALYYTTLHFTALHCTALHISALYYTILHYTPFHCTALHRSALLCTALHCSALLCTVIYFSTLHYTALLCTALQCATLLYYTAFFFENFHFQARQAARVVKGKGPKRSLVVPKAPPMARSGHSAPTMNKRPKRAVFLVFYILEWCRTAVVLQQRCWRGVTESHLLSHLTII